MNRERPTIDHDDIKHTFHAFQSKRFFLFDVFLSYLYCIPCPKQHKSIKRMIDMVNKAAKLLWGELRYIKHFSPKNFMEIISIHQFRITFFSCSPSSDDLAMSIDIKRISFGNFSKVQWKCWNVHQTKFGNFQLFFDDPVSFRDSIRYLDKSRSWTSSTAWMKNKRFIEKKMFFYNFSYSNEQINGIPQKQLDKKEINIDYLVGM